MKRGYTLMELLVVVGVLGLLSVVIAQIFIQTMHTNSKVEVARDVKTSGDRAVDIITRLIQNARSITAPDSCPDGSFGDAFSTLTLTNYDGGQTILSCTMDATLGVARVASLSASQTMYLTGNTVSLYDPGTKTNACTTSAFAFRCSAVNGRISSITTAFSLRQASGDARLPESATATFQSTATLRNE